MKGPVVRLSVALGFRCSQAVACLSNPNYQRNKYSSIKLQWKYLEFGCPFLFERSESCWHFALIRIGCAVNRDQSWLIKRLKWRRLSAGNVTCESKSNLYACQLIIAFFSANLCEWLQHRRDKSAITSFWTGKPSITYNFQWHICNLIIKSLYIRMKHTSSFSEPIIFTQ